MKPMTFRQRVELRVAVADQRHAMSRMATALGTAGTMTTTQGHPWFASLGEQLMTRLMAQGQDALCPHLGRRGFEPMHVEFVGKMVRVYCRDCLAGGRPRLGPVDDSTCDRCSVYTRRGLVWGLLPIGPMLLHFGVCRPCGADLGIIREGAAA